MLINYTMWSSNLFFFFSHPAVSRVFYSPGFSETRFFRVQVFRVQVFLSPGFQGPGPESGSRIWVQVLEVLEVAEILHKVKLLLKIVLKALFSWLCKSFLFDLN